MSSSLAICTFCSHSDKTVHVLCDSRCLLCSRCQLNPTIRKLLIDNTNVADLPSAVTLNVTKEEVDHKLNVGSIANPSVTNDKTQSIKGVCPVCKTNLSRNMLMIIFKYHETFLKSASETQVRTAYLNPFINPLSYDTAYSRADIHSISSWKSTTIPSLPS